jgi:transposase-like protein
MLVTALEVEVETYVEAHAHRLDASGRRQVTRNGFANEREIQTGLGAIPIRQPRVNDRRIAENGERMRFTSKLLPPYLRRARHVEELLPWLYLKGISTSDFPEALSALFGADARGLSPSTIVRLKQVWEGEFAAWTKRSLKGKRYVYFWADGVYLNVRLGEGGSQCVLVIIGATADGKKELVAILDGVRESEQSWRELLLDLKHRGLAIGPELAVGDGALGFWKALAKVYPRTRTQRCWVHKTANVLNCLPKGQQSHAKQKLQAIWMAATKAEASQAFAAFEETYGAKYPKAVECLRKDREELMAFYDFPGEHWVHLRTTNPIESTFATVRLRTNKTKGAGSRIAALTMVFKLAESAEKQWRVLNGSTLLKKMISGVHFKDGIEVAA